MITVQYIQYTVSKIPLDEDPNINDTTNVFWSKAWDFTFLSKVAFLNSFKLFLWPIALNRNTVCLLSLKEQLLTVWIPSEFPSTIG